MNALGISLKWQVLQSRELRCCLNAQKALRLYGSFFGTLTLKLCFFTLTTSSTIVFIVKLLSNTELFVEDEVPYQKKVLLCQNSHATAFRADTSMIDNQVFS